MAAISLTNATENAEATENILTNLPDVVAFDEEEMMNLILSAEK